MIPEGRKPSIETVSDVVHNDLEVPSIKYVIKLEQAMELYSAY